MIKLIKIKIKMTQPTKVKRCKSVFNCNDEDDSKTILPDDYNYSRCKPCRDKEEELSQSIDIINNILIETNADYRLCRKCLSEKLYTLDEMGKTKYGKISNHCLKHYNKRREYKNKK